MLQKKWLFVFFLLNGSILIFAQQLNYGCYLGLTKPADVKLTISENLGYQIYYHNSGFPALQLGYYLKQKHILYQFGLNNLFYNYGNNFFINSDTAQNLSYPFDGEKVVNINVGINFNADYVAQSSVKNLDYLIGISLKDDFGVIWNKPATSLNSSYRINYNKTNFALSLGLKQKVRYSEVLFKVYLPFFVYQNNLFKSNNPLLPIDSRFKSKSYLSFKEKYWEQIGFDFAVIF